MNAVMQRRRHRNRLQRFAAPSRRDASVGHDATSRRSAAAPNAYNANSIWLANLRVKRIFADNLFSPDCTANSLTLAPSCGTNETNGAGRAGVGSDPDGGIFHGKEGLAMGFNPIHIIFGLKVRQARLARSMSITELSERSGLSPSYITEIEKGRKYPKTDRIVDLSQALGYDYDELVSLKLDPPLSFLETPLTS